MDGLVHANLIVFVNRLGMGVKTEQRGTRRDNHGSHEFGDVLPCFPADIASLRDPPEITGAGPFNRTTDFPGPGIVRRKRQGPRTEQVIEVSQVNGGRDC